VAIRGALIDLLEQARSIVSARLFPVAVEIVSPAFANLLGIGAAEPVLLVRFAGNRVGVKYQVEQIRGEVIADDEWIWRAIAAEPLRHSSGRSLSVLPTKLAEAVKEIDVNGAIWQVGAADGRIKILDNVNPTSYRLDSLMQRVKQQLDPSNLFRVQP
jgi:FAD/FMN-containing dehydrogenase